jgi:hypothetical protein
MPTIRSFFESATRGSGANFAILSLRSVAYIRHIYATFGGVLRGIYVKVLFATSSWQILGAEGHRQRRGESTLIVSTIEA